MAGGTGAAKLAQGLAQVLPAERLTVIANTGDDFFRMGLRICPDIDSLIYRLAGIHNSESGWGVAGDTFSCLNQLEQLGEETWFQLGDRDLATHLMRHRLLSRGFNLTEVTDKLLQRFGVQAHLLPMTDAYCPTYLETDQGRMHMQEYFVREGCRPSVRAVFHDDQGKAAVSGAVTQALARADQVVIGPSNPFISISPILCVPGMRAQITQAEVLVTAVSPIVGGRALKGPTARMMTQLGYAPTVLGVADFYGNLIQRIVIDPLDADHEERLRQRGLEVAVMETIMHSDAAKKSLAKQLVESS